VRVEGFAGHKEQADIRVRRYQRSNRRLGTLDANGAVPPVLLPGMERWIGASMPGSRRTRCRHLCRRPSHCEI
jgi:hypothetical protein